MYLKIVEISCGCPNNDSRDQNKKVWFVSTSFELYGELGNLGLCTCSGCQILGGRAIFGAVSLFFHLEILRHHEQETPNIVEFVVMLLMDKFRLNFNFQGRGSRNLMQNDGK